MSEQQSAASIAAAHAASMATFGGMLTAEDWSVEEATEYERVQAEENGEEVDEIVQELPIVLSQQLAQTLYLMQSPLRPPHRPYDAELGSRVSLKVKPIQKKVEMEYTIEDAGVNYQQDGGTLGDDVHVGQNYDHGHQYPVKKLTLQAKPVAPKTNYCAGVLSNGVLHLTPIHAVCRFKPSLSYIDAANSAALADSEAKKEAHREERFREGRMTAEEEMEMQEEKYNKMKTEEGSKELQTVIMKAKKKEYGGGGGAAGAAGAPGGLPGGPMRKQTYAFLKQIEEREAWIPLKVHEPDAPVTTAQFSRMLGNGVNPAHLPSVPFNVAAEHYLAYVNPPDVLDATNANAQSMIATGDPLYLSFEERILHFLRTCRVITFREFCRKLNITTEEQLEVALQQCNSICWVVQGCLVLKSSIAYDRNWRVGMAVPPATQAPAGAQMLTARVPQRGLADRVQLAREYLITQFHKQRIIYRDEVNATLQLELEPLDELLAELAVKNTVDQPQLQIMGVPKGAQWEWKLETANDLQLHFPRLVSHSDQNLPHVEAELRRVLTVSSSHPSRDPASRGLLLQHTEAIVHQLAPAGLTADRTTHDALHSHHVLAHAQSVAAAMHQR